MKNETTPPHLPKENVKGMQKSPTDGQAQPGSSLTREEAQGCVCEPRPPHLSSGSWGSLWWAIRKQAHSMTVHPRKWPGSKWSLVLSAYAKVPESTKWPVVLHTAGYSDCPGQLRSLSPNPGLFKRQCSNLYPSHSFIFYFLFLRQNLTELFRLSLKCFESPALAFWVAGIPGMHQYGFFFFYFSKPVVVTQSQPGRTEAEGSKVPGQLLQNASLKPAWDFDTLSQRSQQTTSAYIICSISMSLCMSQKCHLN